MKNVYPVNWVDGMKISKDHFINTNEYIEALSSYVAGSLMEPFRYGLIYHSACLDGDGRVQNQDLVINIGEDSISLYVNRLFAISFGGNFVQISPEMEITRNIETEKIAAYLTERKSKDFYIVLRIDMENYIPFGVPSPIENSARLPFISPQFTLFLVPASEVSNSFFQSNLLPIGKIVYNGSKFTIDKEYIMPCSVAIANDTIKQIVQRALAELDGTFKNLWTIIEITNNKNSQNELAESLRRVCIRLIMSTQPDYRTLRNFILLSTPFRSFQLLHRFGSICDYSIRSLSPKDREELLNYLSEWSDLKQSDIVNTLASFNDYDYHHYDPRGSLEGIFKQYRVLSTIFATLAQLEFIGKKRGQNIFIKEVAPTYIDDEIDSGKKAGWSPLI
jgi:hypothetical protein